MKKRPLTLILLMVCAIATLWGVLVLTAYAADTSFTPSSSGTFSVTDNSDISLSLNGSYNSAANPAGTGSATYSGGKITLKAKAGSTTSSGCNTTTTYYPTTTKLTMTNNHASKATVTYSSASNLKNANGQSLSSSGSFTIEANGGTFSLSITSEEDDTEVSGSITVTSITYAAIVTDATITLQSPSNGTYTAKAGSTNLTVGQSYTYPVATTYTFVATPNANYVFSGWYVNNELKANTKTYTAQFTENSTIEARFVVDPLYDIMTTASGSAYTKDELVAVNSAYSHSTNKSYVWSTGSHTQADGHDVINKDDLLWSKSGTTIVNSASGTSTGDYYSGFGEQSNAPAVFYSDIIRIYAKKACTITYYYSLSGSPMQSGHSEARGLFIYQAISTNSGFGISNIATSANQVATTTNTSLSGSTSATLNAGEYLYILVKDSMNSNSKISTASMNYSCSNSLSNFQVSYNEEKTTISVSNVDNLGNALNSGSVNVNRTNQSVSSGAYSAEVSPGTEFTLKAGTAPTNYVFCGWDVDGTKYYGRSEYNFTIAGDTVIKAIYVPKMTITASGTNGYGSATYSYKNISNQTVTPNGEYVARNEDWSQLYTSLDQAFANSNTVVLLADATFNGNLTIPSGKTLAIPYGLADTGSTSVTVVDTTGAASAYCTLTMNGNLTINGNLVVGGRQSSKGNGYATQGVGILNTASGKTVAVNSGANLCAFGYVKGSGAITVASGGTVYEFMVISSLRSIGTMESMASDKRVFPFPNFYIRNVVPETTYNTGASLKASYAAYINAGSVAQQAVSGTVNVFGQNGSMFNFSTGSITKYLDTAKNQTVFQFNSNANATTGSFSISMSISGYPIELNTSNYYLPLNYSFGFVIKDGAKLTLNDKYVLLPGASIDVESGGELEIASAANLVLYRLNDYDYRSSSGESAEYEQGYSPNGVVPGAPAIPGVTVTSKTLANVSSAVLNVDGNVTVKGGLYVTNDLVRDSAQGQGSGKVTYNQAAFVSPYPYSNGYSVMTGTGKIDMTSAKTNVTNIEEVIQKTNSKAPVYCSVSITPIRGLTNYDTTSNDGYTDYTSFTTTNWYGYINDSNVNVWSTLVPATLSYNANTGTGTAPAAAKKPANTEMTVATNTLTAPAHKEFDGWNTAADGSGTAYAAGDSISIATDTTLYAQWKGITYALAFKYQTGQLVNGTLSWADEKSGYTVNYTYDGTIKEPTLRYYSLEYWTLNDGETHYDLTGINEAVKNLIADGTSPASITVKAFFVRQSYKIEVYHIMDDVAPAAGTEPTESATVNVGRSISINAPETLPSDAAYKFAYWTIGDDSTRITDRKTSYFNGDTPDTTVKFYAHYTMEGGGTTRNDAQVFVQDYFVEPSGDGYTVGMTLQVIAPTDTTKFSINKVDNKYQVGFGYTTIKSEADKPDNSGFGKKLSNNWGATWTSGTYVMRFWVSNDTTWYSYGFVQYTLDGENYQTKYATYKNQNSDTRIGYDTMDKNGPVREAD